MEMVDRTGQPRSNADVREAIGVVEKMIVKLHGGTPPEVYVMLPIIHQSLKELLVYRNAVRFHNTVEEIQKLLGVTPQQLVDEVERGKNDGT